MYAVAVYGMDHLQCYWLLDNLIDKRDEVVNLAEGNSAMAFL